MNERKIIDRRLLADLAKEVGLNTSHLEALGESRQWEIGIGNDMLERLVEIQHRFEQLAVMGDDEYRGFYIEVPRPTPEEWGYTEELITSGEYDSREVFLADWLAFNPMETRWFHVASTRYGDSRSIRVTDRKRTIQRFYLFRSGKAFVTNMDEFKSCREVRTKDNDKAVFEVSIDSFYLDKPSPYDFGYVAARQSGIEVKTCQFCKYHKNGYEVGYGLLPIFCCLYKRYGTPENPEPQYAKECEYYREDKRAIEEISSQMPAIVIVESK